MLHAYLDPAVVVAAVFAVSLLAPFLFLVRIRNAERRRREPWRWVLFAFSWGFLPAIVIAYIAETYVMGLNPLTGPLTQLTFLTVVVAPIAEEAAKALGLLGIRDRDPERHDGFVYGAAAGFGFAFTENLFYALATYEAGGRDAALAVAVFRGIVTVSLHGAATAFSGYAIWRLKYGWNPLPLLVYFPLAVLLHAAYNALASVALAGAVLAAAILAVGTYWRVARRVRRRGRGA